MLHILGEKIASFLREPESSIDSVCRFEEAWARMGSFYTFCDLLPYESFEEETNLFHNKHSLGFVIETSCLVGSSESMQREISNLCAMMLPENSSLQVILWADSHIGEHLQNFIDARKNAPDILKDLATRRMDYFSSLHQNASLKPFVLRHFRVLLCFSVPDKHPMVLQRNSFLRLQNQIQSSLEMLGLSSYVWKASDFLSTLRGILHMDANNVMPHKLRWNKFESLSSQLSNGESNFQVSAEHLLNRSQNRVIRTYSVRQFPSQWSMSMMGELIGDLYRDQAQIPCPFMFHYGIHIPSSQKHKNKILAKAAYVEKQAHSPIGQYLPDIQREHEELAFVRDQINKGERVVQTQFNVILLSPLAEIDVADQTLQNIFTSKEWKLERNTYLHLPIFLSSLPMMWGEEMVSSLLHLQKLKTTLSTESANLLPIQGEWLGTKTPGLVLSGRRGQLMNWYPFDNDHGNYNTCVVGRSGSGKSVFMQELMTSTLGLGGRVFVLDVGRSFEKTCFLLEGQFIEFTPKIPLCLNPFSTIPINNQEAAEDALAMLKNVLVSMAAPSRGVDDKGSALLEQAMIETWNTYKQRSTITLIATWLNQHTDEHAKDLGQMLFPYTESGTYGRFFAGPSTVNFYKNLVVVELEELKERKDLQAVIVQMVIINITNQMFLGDRTTPFHIVFDEAWDMLRGAQSGVFIETLARRLRKYRGSLIVGTQSINDFFVNPGAQAAFDNSDWMCMLSQKPESIEQLKKANRLSLTPYKESLLKSVQTKQGKYAEIMISGSQGYAVGRLLLDPFSNLLYSTKAEDYSALNALKDKGYTTKEAILYLLETRKEG